MTATTRAREARKINTPAHASATGIRLDIEGLRAIAVLAVLVYHLRPEWLPGGFAGVDMFFVISGFLITSHLMREAESRGTVSLRTFYARRIMRLIPAATVVLVTTVIGVFLFAPRLLWSQIGIDVIGAATYSLNWILANRSVDYLAEGSAASPVQHFWSLAVEEQFYLIWPLLIVLAIVFSARVARNKRTTASALAGAVLVLSLAFAIQQSIVADVSAYFVTTTRLWELAAGALVALTIDRVRLTLPAVVRSILVTLGIAMVAWCLFFIDDSFWPSALTVIPVVGICFVILAGGNEQPSVGERALSAKPLVWIGGISYAVYLWHWPLIVVAGYKWDSPPLAVSIGIPFLSVGLAWATSRVVESPLRFNPWFKARTRRSFAFGFGAMLFSVVLGASLVLAGPGDALRPPSGAVAVGAEAIPLPIDPQAETSAQWLQGVTWALPSPMDAAEDVPVIYADGCQQDTVSSEPISCTYGDVDSDTTMVVVGDSKAAQWMPALIAIAEQSGMRLVTFFKSSCAFADAPIERNGDPYPSCAEWNARVVEQITTLRPGLVVTSQVKGLAYSASGEDQRTRADRMRDGLLRTWGVLRSLGSKLAVIGDTPQVGSNVFECVAENAQNLDACSYDRRRAESDSALPTQEAAVTALGGRIVVAGAASAELTDGTDGSVALIDMNDVVCPSTEQCPAIVGNTLIYRTGSHITATYVTSATPLLSEALAVVDALPSRHK
ncbi:MULTISPECIES: acyltransferase family protein [Microbacterium]|uniref:acyltransferase family protein n=1 Tax=Microbacterium TaxID=33882 RepID=UPI0027836BF7|nr:MULTISPECIES: acyltransferase family protein [Microbacterium]MDQ1074382.1 peptidoglycan/LPS O-acetylase OafA/YrhL [Microbacterium sp. SORGH_AS_0969]MDQ1114612.1 peptidoglycan/LPS O-acetylase OafA/YrhL [Microbacterium testaceum]